jgi:hypothetical protein
MQQTGYSGIINAIVDLQTRGFSFDFSLVGNKLLCAQQKFFLRDEEFDILEMHHFQMEDHGRRETVIYGIESPQHGIRGIMLIHHPREKDPDPRHHPSLPSSRATNFHPSRFMESSQPCIYS